MTPVLRLPLLGLSVGGLLAGCATVAPSSGPSVPVGARPGTSAPPARGPAPEDATDVAMTYVCRDGKRFKAAYALSGQHALVTAGGRSYRLPHAPSASGARFAQGGVELWTQGPQARLDGAAGAPYRNCSTG